jgi:hypothetical protein
METQAGSVLCLMAKPASRRLGGTGGGFADGVAETIKLERLRQLGAFLVAVSETSRTCRAGVNADGCLMQA